MAKLPTSTGFSCRNFWTIFNNRNQHAAKKHRRKPFPIDAAGNMVIEPPTATNNKAQRNKSKPPSAASHWESLSQGFGSGEKYHKLELVFWDVYSWCIYDIYVCFFGCSNFSMGKRKQKVELMKEAFVALFVFCFLFNVFLIRDIRSCYMLHVWCLSMLHTLADSNLSRHSDTQNWMPYNILRQLPRMSEKLRDKLPSSVRIFRYWSLAKDPAPVDRIASKVDGSNSRGILPMPMPLKIGLLPKRKGSSSNHPFSGGKIRC